MCPSFPSLLLGEELDSPVPMTALSIKSIQDTIKIEALSSTIAGLFYFFPRLPARYNKNKYEMASCSKHELMLGLGLISKKQLSRL